MDNIKLACRAEQVLIPCRDSLFMELGFDHSTGKFAMVLIPCRDSLFMEPPPKTR